MKDTASFFQLARAADLLQRILGHKISKSTIQPAKDSHQRHH